MTPKSAVAVALLGVSLFGQHLAVGPMTKPLPPEPVVAAATTPVTTTGHSARGQASWYCRPGSSVCTSGFPASGMYAAAGPALRVGNWRGRTVTVTAGGRSVRVKLIDWCGCPSGRVLDLYSSAFKRLAPLSQGVMNVKVSW